LFFFDGDAVLRQVRPPPIKIVVADGERCMAGSVGPVGRHRIARLRSARVEDVQHARSAAERDMAAVGLDKDRQP
jgi:hypothetical protein